ncbi:FeoC-like transcriptional regulator [Saezia sanguinis]|uniref:FeoC-like transcriptional regulator n=1 Tax=Saezia sanguinis TaxID=1965230 RepID=UPI00303D94F6
MTPSELRDYLKQHHQASLADLAIHFNSDPQAVKAAMHTWIRKGMASETSASSGCAKGCCECKPENITVYRWLS